MNGVHVLDGSRQAEICAELDALAFDEDGRLRVLPAREYQRHPQADLTVWCVLRGLYCLPTVELVAAVRELLPERWSSCQLGAPIEIGAGNGAFGRALGVRMTDSHQQELPEVREYYHYIRQATVRYGVDVERRSAEEAVRAYEPEVVVAAWVTHRYEPERHEAGGNVMGIDEGALLRKVRRYVHVGHERVHAGKALLALPHRTLRPEGLVSRALDWQKQVIWVWEGDRA
jgi:hypothetical protein